MPKVLAVIPARLASTRLANKPLQDICGKTLIQRVWERARLATTISELVIATDSEEIASNVKSFGGNVMMTDPELQSGSERVAACAEMLGKKSWDIFLNIQGDMPFISSEVIDKTVLFLADRKDKYDMATIASPLDDEEAFLSPHVVKVVIGDDGRALYFSRSPIPHSRDGKRLNFSIEGKEYNDVFSLKHFGLYAFTQKGLDIFTHTKPGRLEVVEKLEQLKAMELGFRIGVCLIRSEVTSASVEVDTPEDLEKARKIATKC